MINKAVSTEKKTQTLSFDVNDTDAMNLNTVVMKKFAEKIKNTKDLEIKTNG